ncbi:protein MFI isoform 7-T7 [Anableps anableps]
MWILRHSSELSILKRHSCLILQQEYLSDFDWEGSLSLPGSITRSLPIGPLWIYAQAARGTTISSDARSFCIKKVKSRDEPTEICTNKRIDFHPSKMKRREDVRKWKKRKKIEWLRQMYSEGRLQAHSDQAHLVTLARSSAQEVIETIEKKGDDEILDWELDELLAWTDSLNFEEYMEEWQHLACSYPSERSTGYPICTPILDLHDLGAAKL